MELQTRIAQFEEELEIEEEQEDADSRKINHIKRQLRILESKSKSLEDKRKRLLNDIEEVKKTPTSRRSFHQDHAVTEEWINDSNRGNNQFNRNNNRRDLENAVSTMRS